jgi:hypothetical protein
MFSGLLEEVIQQVVAGRLPENLHTSRARLRSMQASHCGGAIRGGNGAAVSRWRGYRPV